MATKTFRAPNMLSALQNVQQELGADAIVLSMKQTPPGKNWMAWGRKGCEVIAMPNPAPRALNAPNPASLEIEATQTVEPKAAQAKPALIAQFPIQPSVEAQVAAAPVIEKRQQPDLTRIHALDPFLQGSLYKHVAAKKDTSLPQGLARLRDQLTAQGVDSFVVDKLVASCNQMISSQGFEEEGRIREFARQVLEAGIKITTKATITPPNRVMCLIGSNGSGKTSSCAKLASFFAITMGKKVVWIGADTIRTGAIAEARAYTEALDIPLELVYSPEDMPAALASHREADLILIDTPGCNPLKEDQLVELGSFLTQAPSRATYLVAAATTKENDLNQAISSFYPFSLKGMVITRMDETSTIGSIYNLACQSRVPLAYLCSGNRALGDLRVAQPADLVSNLFERK